MAGILYLVATPIGNLGDFSPRAVETLAQADFIAAEDTRVSVKLLNHFDIKKPLVSYHEHNRAAAGQAILERLLSGETCALVTDAGTPAISDPGQELVALCAENGEEGVLKAVEGRPDVILMDIQLPVLDGFGALERIRGSEAASIPVIAVTAHFHDREALLASGFDDFLPKPVDLETLNTKIEFYSAK